MRSNSCDFNPKKIVIISKYHSPGVYFEKVDRDPSKHGAIVEIDSEKFVPLVVQARIDVDPVFGKILWNQISLSNRFCTGLSSWLFHQWFTKNEWQGNDHSHTLHRRLQLHLGRASSLFLVMKTKKSHFGHCRISAFISIKYPACLLLEPDLSWSKRLLVGLREYMQLQGVMAWLSTLGGAYSAMGEYINSYSEKAGQISYQQLLVAIRLGNPILAAQCKVFAALSLIQRGKFKLAARIIREQYRLAGRNGYARDDKLIASCQAAWSRMQFLQRQRKKANKRSLETVS
ncbi:uncharacterized protein LOC114965984 [Acropora millepora]|uniref:uncharacterized protein LOC114965984 n=1 Tax=Acropora millepora TaxID=45264 RepID=UPI001CF1D6F7|nr:uncharacterized protein LOC114965984 [Acropora millepora]